MLVSVDAILIALRKPGIDGEVINVASGNPISIRTVIDMVHEMIGAGHPIYGKIPYRAGENMSLFSDVTKARRMLGWKSTTNLINGLSKTICSIGK